MDHSRRASRGRGRGFTERNRGGRGQSDQSDIAESRAYNNNTHRGSRNGGTRRGGTGSGRGWMSGYEREGRGAHHGHALQQSGGGQDIRRGIGFGLLKIWSDTTDSEELLIQLCNKIDSLEDLMMGDRMREDWYSLLVQIINTALLCQHHSHKLKRLLKAVCTTHFLTQMLSMYLEQRIGMGMRWIGAEEFFNSVLKIIKQIVKHLPENAQNCKLPLTILNSQIIDIEPLSTNHSLMESIRSLILVVTKVHLDRIERQKSTKSYQPCSDSETPPDDFRQLSVIPTISDLSTDVKPFVRAIITKGVYRDQEHYLDILFRLMREDFVKPLRSGIQEYREHINDKNFKNSHLRLYHGVHFTGMTHVNGINHVVQFDVSNMKHVKWDHSKRLLNGNLLCLSDDNFQSTLIFATVSFRKTDLLKKGIINVVCHTGMNVVLKSSSNDTFVMAETMAYYEAVHPILKGLQAIDSDLPLSEYIITCQKQLKPPTYLLKEVRMYDLSCMMKTPNSTKVPVLNPLRWPPTESMCLNACQREAAILALTKEISIIQGPPGTGKTYVGLKVMQVLLENKDRILANDQSEHDPILVICYTNHALDQFLEGIIGFCPHGIVRVGGKSSSVILESFNLVNVKKKMKIESKAWKHSLWVLRKSLESHMSNIDDVKRQVETLASDVLNEETLKDCISQKHYDSLQSTPSEGKKRSKIHQWLNASNKPLIEALPAMIKHHLTNLVLQTLGLRRRNNMVCFDSNASVIDRINIYGFWLSQYQSNLRMEKEAEQDISRRKYLDTLYGVSKKSSILNDSEIGSVIHPEHVEQIIASVTTGQSDSLSRDSIVETWILGLHHELNKQLDDVEELSCFIKKSLQRNGDEIDDFDDKEESDMAKQHRQIFEEDRDEMEKLKQTLQVKGGPLFLLNRAKLLGINEDVDDEEDEANQPSVDSDGFTLVTRKKTFKFSQVRRFLSDDKFQPAGQEEEESIEDVWNLSMPKRFCLYKLWIQRYKDILIQKIEELIQEYKNTKEELTETRMKEDIDVLRQARVIGMTTTGAAKKRAWLEAVGCRIIIVEEAAEVLEAHIVTALNKNCKHLILIGDHKQLRPNPTVYEHAKHFGLDVSLFERLVNNGIPHVTLREQHRMRENISVIMRHIYPSLEDHISVKNYENIRGISKNIFFIQHNQREESTKDTMSKSNPYEAEYLIRLCNYLLLQGYEPSNVTVLATYAGQVLALKKEMKKQNLKHGFRVTAVDNFQGEENDIILLSLVRSNEQSIAGFLKVDNRVCVALSRAKKGMFAIGNISLLATQSDLWKNIKETAEREGIIGNGLPVSCSNHPDGKDEIKFPKDFDRCPQGGCMKKCDFRLDCGHTCHLQCHGYDLEHKELQCQGMCKNTCKAGHPCMKRCWQECGVCTVPVKKTITSCGHTNDFGCNETPKDTDCYSQCEEILPCYHRCEGKCGLCKKNSHRQCKVPVTYFWRCDHAVKVPCHFKPTENPCPKPCGEILQCGHKCPGKCSDCLGGAVHVACREKCRKILFCGHICRSVCSVPCPPCSMPCPVACEHGPCSHRNKKRTCGDLCILCQEQCLNNCPHRKCARRCHEKCDVLPCEKSCQKMVAKCGHPCSGLCGETCVCRKCDYVSKIGTDSTTSVMSYDIEREDESDILFKVASCAHVFNLKEIDRYVNAENRKCSTEFILCPECSSEIQKCRRYATICKERFDRREQEKKRFSTSNQIKKEQKWNLRESLRLLFDSDTSLKWFEWRHMEDDRLETAGEIATTAAKLKFAYVICEILSLNQESASLDNGNDGHDRISALLKVKSSMSFQQIEEYKLDLKRILLCRYSDALTKMAKSNNADFAEDTMKNWTLVLNDLKAPKTSSSLLDRGMVMINSMEHAMESECAKNANLQAICLIKKTIVERIFNVLMADNDEMLNEVIQSKTGGTPRLDRSSILEAKSKAQAAGSNSSDSYNDGASVGINKTNTKIESKTRVSLRKFLGNMGISSSRSRESHE